MPAARTKKRTRNPVPPPEVDLGYLLDNEDSDSGYETESSWADAEHKPTRPAPKPKKQPSKPTKRRQSAQSSPKPRLPNGFIIYKNEFAKRHPEIYELMANDKQRMRLIGRIWSLEKREYQDEFHGIYHEGMQARHLQVAELDPVKRRSRADNVTAKRRSDPGKALNERGTQILELFKLNKRGPALVEAFRAWEAKQSEGTEGLVSPVQPPPRELRARSIKSADLRTPFTTPPLSPSSPSRVTTPGLYSSMPTTPSAFSSRPTTPSTFRRLADISPDYGYDRKASVESEDSEESNALRVSFETESEAESEDGDFVVASTPHVYDDGPDDVPVDALDQAEFEDAQAMLVDDQNMLVDEPTLAYLQTSASGTLSDDALDPALLDFGSPLPYDDPEPSTSYAISNDGYERLLDCNTYCHPAESPAPDWFGLRY